MKIHEIKINQQFDAPVEQIWEAFNDHASFGKMLGQKIFTGLLIAPTQRTSTDSAPSAR